MGSKGHQLLTAGDKMVATDFCEKRDIDASQCHMWVSGRGNIVIVTEDGCEYVLRPNGHQLGATNRVDEDTQDRTGSDWMRLSPYLDTHRESWEPEVIDEVGCLVATGKILDESVRPLVRRVTMDADDEERVIVFRYEPVDSLAGKVSFASVTAHRARSKRECERVGSAHDEALFLASQGSNPEMFVSEEVKNEAIRACKAIARSFSACELDRLGTISRKGPFFTQVNADRARARGFQDGCVTATKATDATIATDGIGQRRVVQCSFGKARAYYDVLTKRATLDEEDVAAARRHVARWDRQTTYQGLLECFEMVFPDDDITIDAVGDIDAKICGYRGASYEVVVDVAKFEEDDDIDDYIDAIEEQRSRTMRQKEKHFAGHGILGAILPMSIVEFVAKNRGGDAWDYITRNTIIKEMKGRKTSIPGGVAHTDLLSRMGVFTEREASEVLATLIDEDILRTVQRSWDYGTYENILAGFGAFDTYRLLSKRPAEDGTPVEAMTEWQLLSLLDGDVASRPFERLAQELPALLDHPACYYAHPEKFMAYIKALPDELHDYVRVAYKMATDRTQRKMFRAVIAQLDGDNETVPGGQGSRTPQAVVI